MNSIGNRALLLLPLLLLPAQVRGEGPPADRWFSPNLGRTVQVPAEIRSTPDFAQLAYKEGESPRGVRVDLNDDTTDDYILIDSGEYCGTGGCPYKLFDGRTYRLVGSLFGDPLILSETRINGFPVLHAYAHVHAGGGSYTTYVFDGSEYRAVSSIFLTADSLDRLFEDLRSSPKLTDALPASGTQK
jgi:hypothetical protein